ncbi:UDP-N-acetylmuramoyl-L-alanine--D-glutamate ligase, partial [Patescibacteria group bacterium]|nr:UDP-N-acetylmuramoyl-L-alanine--D-glutamate ligase [Patescibacteria group bacterium]
AELLKEKYQTILAGNIGVSPLEFLDDIKKNSKVVLELSSFILEDLQKSPQIAVITNLFPDHLNRYKDFNHYVEAKKNIFRYQEKNDVLVLNKDLKMIANEANSKVFFFDGENNSAAITVAKILKVPDKKIQRVVATFKGVPHRQEFVADKNGVKYFNDTAATNPGAVKYALEKFKKDYPHIILIAGGENKKLNYRALAEDIKKSATHLVLLPGSASELIKRDLKKFSVYEVKSMKMAVKRASQLAEKGDIVLLSPGAASFNLFKNEFDRGNQFIKAVNNL